MPSFVFPSQRLRALVVCGTAALLLLGGCASTGDPRDPLEPMNRAIYKFNDGVDNIIVKPAAGMYRDLVPPVIRTGVSNFFSNINDVLQALNNLLQGKMPEAVNDVGRILVNTTLGVFGTMDVATKLGVEKHNEDFGQTLGYWGVGDGPYIVLPILGPSNLRDTVGWVGDIYSWPVTYIDSTKTRNVLIGLRFISLREELLEASNILETAALDPYAFVRDAYIQRRRNQVHDGNPPEEREDEGDGKDKSGSNGAAPAVTGSAPASIIVGGEFQPTPAELEARERAQKAASQEAPRQQPARVVKLWFSPSRN